MNAENFAICLIPLGDVPSKARGLATLLIEKSNLEKNAANFRLSFRESLAKPNKTT